MAALAARTARKPTDPASPLESRLAFLRRHLPAVALLLLASIIEYHQLVFQNRILVGYDTLTYFYPNEHFMASALRSGSLPLWNPYLFTGVPFLANVQTAVFYPLNLLFLLLPVPRAYAISVVTHVFLAGLFAYAFATVTLRVRNVAAICTGLTFGLSGFIAALAGHLNQLQASAWLPLLLLSVDAVYRRRSVTLVMVGSVVLALQFLAGHMQEFYMSVAAAALFALWLTVRDLIDRSRTTYRHLLGSYLALAVMGGIGMALTAVQLLPTYELTRESIRAAGMPYEEASAFSLPPWLLLRSLLPAYGDPQPFSEWIGYVGIVPLFLAGWAIARKQHFHLLFFALLSALALFLALGQFNPLYQEVYGHVPGLSLFRVPARWLLLYTFGIAALAGIGLDAFAEGMAKAHSRTLLWGTGVVMTVLLIAAALLLLLSLTLNPKPPGELPSVTTSAIWIAAFLVSAVILANILRLSARISAAVLVSLSIGELLLASQGMDLNRVNLTEAVSTLRPSVAHLRADGGLYRTLAFSEGSFDPGDLAQLKMMTEKVLAPDAVYDYVVTDKHKETLTPNLPLLFRVPSLDGYDGGVLPLRRYVAFKSILPLSKENAADGRLREQLKSVPDVGLLSFLNVKYILTDRIHDVWIDGVYYDLGLTRRLSGRQGVTLSNTNPQQATVVGLVTHLTGAAMVPDGTPVAEVAVTTSSGTVYTSVLRAGVDTAEGEHSPSVAHRLAQKARSWPRQPDGYDYVTKFALPQPDYVDRVVVRSSGSVGTLVLKGVTLIDERRQMTQTLVIEPDLQLSHLGDVKIYENGRALERAFLVHDVLQAQTDAEALAMLRQGAFDPTTAAVVIEDEWRAAGADVRAPLEEDHRVSVADYQPERVLIKTESRAAGLLVLTDSHYPGWKVTVDGKSAAILRANYLFRAVALPAGSHTVEFVYEPNSLRVGAVLSFSALVLVIVGLLLGSRIRL